MGNKIEIASGLSVGRGEKLLVIAGPCQIESYDHCARIAEHLLALEKQFPIRLVFKSSFDKANRTSLKAARGIGLHEGLRVLEDVRTKHGLPILTDVHSAEQVPAVAAVVDVLQTPAFLCRQTDLLLAVGACSKAVNVKKGQFLAPQDMRHVAEKIASKGNKKILLCERGACFGYRDLVVDMRSLVIMAEFGYPVIFDATHSVQSMGGGDSSKDGASSGGNRAFVAPLARAAVAVGVDGVFIECHDDPYKAPSDGPSMLRLEEVRPLIADLCRIRESRSV